MNHSTIAAIATPTGQGGIGIVKLSGPEALTIAAAIFSPVESMNDSISSVFSLQSHRFYLGHIFDPGNQHVLDEVLLCAMKAPRSYTREDVIEIQAHGGQVAVHSILELVLKQGARLAEPGEFTRRAFLNGRIDLTQAEAVIDIINARSEKALQAASSHIRGTLRTSVINLRETLVELLVQIEAGIDFPDEVDDYFDRAVASRKIAAGVIKPLKRLIRHYDEGHLLRNGLKVAVVGRPNVGKSSLLNQLIQKDRAIVTAAPGTTRDTIEETLNINGFPVILADTAGLHASKDPIEALGMAKTLEMIESAHLVMLMIEANRPLTQDDYEIFDRVQSKPFIIAANKIDLVNGRMVADLPASWSRVDVVEISALSGKNIDLLKERIIVNGVGGESDVFEDDILPNLRHKLLMEDSLRAARHVVRGLATVAPLELVAINIKEVVDSLDQILGNNVPVDILDQIFSRFCIGK